MKVTSTTVPNRAAWVCAACSFWLFGPFTTATAQQLTTIQNSPTISEVLSLNDRGWVLGRREVGVKNILSMEYYVRREGNERPVPIPESFTHIEAIALDGHDQCVGFATRPAGHPDGNQRALVHSLSTGSTSILPLPLGFNGSCAFDISRDGTTVSGYVTGSDPARQRPCIWTRQNEAWTITLLPVANPFNPLLTSAQVHISQDGQRVAASIVQQVTPHGSRLYALCLWRHRTRDVWDAQWLTDQAVHVADINDQEMIAGYVISNHRRHVFIYDPDNGPQVVPTFGRGSSYATSINSQGQVVGVLEDPPGREGTMTAFLWDDRELQALPLDVETVASTANTITDGGQVGGLVVRAGQATDDSQTESYILRLNSD